MEVLVALASMLDLMNPPKIPNVISEIGAQTEYIDLSSIEKMTTLLPNENLQKPAQGLESLTADGYSQKSHLTVDPIVSEGIKIKPTQEPTLQEATQPTIGPAYVAESTQIVTPLMTITGVGSIGAGAAMTLVGLKRGLGLFKSVQMGIEATKLCLGLTFFPAKDYALTQSITPQTAIVVTVEEASEEAMEELLEQAEELVTSEETERENEESYDVELDKAITW